MLNEQTGTRRPQPTYVQAVATSVEPANVTVRRVRRTRPHGFLALPDGTSQPWFDQLSRDLMRLLVTDPYVHSFKPRPANLKLTIDGDLLEHIPDFQVRYEKGAALVDIVRPQRLVRDESNRIKDLPYAMAQICQKRGLRYSRIRPSTIYSQPRWANACELMRFKSVELTPEFTFRTIDFLSRQHGVATIAEAQTALGGRDFALPQLYAMALRKLVVLDMSEYLGTHTTVRLLAENAVHQ